ncbi:MAG: outer membrane lipoprotein-sorting protein [Haloferula sp.]
MMRYLMVVGFVAGLLGSVRAQDAAQLLERARLATTLQESDLTGTIRKGRQKTAVSLFLRGKNIQFTTNDGAERFHMRLGDEKIQLLEIINGKTQPFADKKLRQPIAGSDLTYEDLSMRFFYWPKPQLLGGERVKTYDCWKIRINNPGHGGDYGVVYVWIHKKFGAFMKIEGFDRQGNRLKQFTVEDVMKLSDGSYTLKKMEVQSHRGGKVTGRSYLEFEKPSRPGPKGPR